MSEIRMEDNGSAKYDGVTQDISCNFVTEENVAVGDKVTIKCSQRARDGNDDGEYIATGVVLTHSPCMCIT